MLLLDGFPATTPGPPTASHLNFLLDIAPASSSTKRYLWLPRLKVDDVEVQIRGSVRFSEDENSIGQTLTVTLLNDIDRGLFIDPEVPIDFGIGRYVGGVWDESTFVPLLEDARVAGISYDIQGGPQNMTDKVTVTIISQASSKLNKTSESGLIVYDSDRVTITDEDLKAIPDANGAFYIPTVVAIPAMKLSDLFGKILVEECGFDHYKTNLPADGYPIQRYEVKLGERFYDGLKGFIGMYSPAVTLVDDDIWIMDMTSPQPEGFPDPKYITLDDPLSITTQETRQNLDGLMVQYVGLENNYDFTTFRYEYPINTSGNIRTESELISIEFRKNTHTGSIVVREAINIENRRSFLNDIEIDNSSESTEFTGNGWPSHIRKTTQKLLPPGSDPTSAPVMQNALTETEEYMYAPHPFKRLAQYIARRSYHSEGVITRDTDNTLPDGTPYLRDLTTAQRSGNVASGQSFISGPIKTREETTVPLRNGNVRFREYEVDEMSGMVVVDRVGEKTGDIALSGVQSTQQQLLVLAPGETTRTAKSIEDFAVGELPLQYAEPLAERIILQRQAGAATLSVPLLGYDKAIKKGIPVKITDRDLNDLGKFTIVGWSMDIDGQGGLITTISCKGIASSVLPLQQIPSYMRTMDASEQLTFGIPIDCTTGYTLRVLQGAVGDAVIEARHGSSGAWTDIEATELDLSPYDGTTQNFEIRITAGAVSLPTRVQFDLNVDLAI